MRICVLHSDVAADARPDELDTLVAAGAVAAALMELGHTVVQVPFVAEPEALAARVRDTDLVFNLVESVFGQDELAMLAPAMLERLGARYTGANAAAIALTADKPAAKRVLRAAGLATPGWAEAPDWAGLDESKPYIVKSATADASIGLDDASIVKGSAAVKVRAQECVGLFGGRWFAERFIDGREFNIALLDEGDGPHVLPLAEMRFIDWETSRPKIVGYAAKWDDADVGGAKMIRSFDCTAREPALARKLRDMALASWELFGLSGYARIDFRVEGAGAPMILEANPNPCLEPGAGFAAAAHEAGYSYAELIGRIAEGAHG